MNNTYGTVYTNHLQCITVDIMKMLESSAQIRLVNGNGQCNGHVEILYNGAWGTVCDDYWDINAAQVVCRQLNCGQALAFNGSAAFGQGQGVIVLDDVQCTGNEQHVWDCLHQPFTVHNCGHNEDAGVVCSGSGSDLSIRLVNGNGQCNGRVEILYNGAWGTVCDDYWDINAAQVVCRQLNCGQALAFNGSAAFGQGQGVIVLDDVQCTGNEQHVWDCLHQPFTVHNCGHNEDAGVVCSGSGSDLSIRLVNGNGQCNGRVEILYNGAWGTVCDDYWDINAAQVVCRQLNCGQALAFNGSAAFGQGQGVIVLDDVQCTGNEQHVWDCLHQPFTVHNCGHNEDAGVVCSGKPAQQRRRSLRLTQSHSLVNGNGQCNGRVEILYNGAWGTVCDDYWDINAAQVVCRQLNCGQALAFNGSAAFGQGQGVIVLDDVQCTGNEQHVWDCLHQPFTVHNCGHNEDAGVVCSGSGSDLSIRLVNGNGQCNGRVEILYNGAWGTVCDDYWDINAAQVVCRQLNCGQALAFNGSAAFGQGQGVIVLDDVQCTGNEQHVWDCLHQPFTVHNCGHNEDAGVVCSVRLSCYSDYMIVWVSLSYLQSLEYTPDQVFLNDPWCRPQVLADWLEFKTNYHECLTVKQVENDTISYTNTLVTNSANTIVTHKKKLCLNVKCRLYQETVVEGMYAEDAIKTKTLVQYGMYAAELTFFQSSSFIQPVNDYPYNVELNQHLHLQITVHTSDPTMVLFLDTCVESANAFEFTRNVHYIIRNGCIRVQHYKTYPSPSNNVIRFGYNAFSFSRNQCNVYILCKIVVCSEGNANSRCSQGCARRRKRTTDSLQHKEINVVAGPLHLQH
ncbi:scavenger receptor cysteine-rich domain-containing protein DMBT1-like [Ranitomeya imitator]|uniref:scavenger receptor cysteine-rich domain-containing protein DMBT1-like n=1 Tax=Ranitomeya imitator TaxID=111125 RepID=UPI0037E863B8